MEPTYTVIARHERGQWDVQADGCWVASCDSQSTAEQFAAAPEYLKALQRAELSTTQICVAANIGHTSIKDKLRWYESQLEQLGRELRAAIAKAEGE